MSTDTGILGRLRASGTPYEVGAQLGRYGAAVTHGYLVSSSAWRSVMAFRADSRVSAMRQIVEARFPECWLEIQGLAHGLELPLEDVFLWNCRGDLWAMAPDGCTTVQIPADEPVVAHNEDGDPKLRGHCALAQVGRDGETAFTTFVYPASLPGHTFALTATGLVQTVNNVRSHGIGAGVPRMVLGRAVLDCATLDDAIRLIETVPRAGSFHFTLAQRGDSRLVSVEFTHAGCSVVRLQRPSCHANHLIHPDLAHERQVVTSSSAARQRRADEIIRARAANALDPLTILWDRSNPDLPVHRTQPHDPDGENTLASAVFHVRRDAVTWKIYDRAGAPPRYTLADALLG